MRIKNTHIRRKILFKRWTRTPWAVFTSLKVVVHNHCTKISSFKDSLLKQQGANRSDSISLFDELDTMSEFAAKEVPWDEELCLNNLFLERNTTNTIEMKEAQEALLYNYQMIPVD